MNNPEEKQNSIKRKKKKKKKKERKKKTLLIPSAFPPNILLFKCFLPGKQSSVAGSGDFRTRLLSNIGENTPSSPQLYFVSLLSCSLPREALTFPHREGPPVGKEELGFLSFFLSFWSNCFPKPS